MITVSKATSAGYYSGGDGNGGGMESYYLDAVTEGEPPGKWLGSGAALLGLSGEVDAADMETLYEEFVNPVTGEQLGNRPAGRAGLAEKIRVARAAEPDASPERLEQIAAEVKAAARTTVIGWDLTFGIPKSISVLHTAANRGAIAASRAGDDARAAAFTWVREQIDAAIDEANRIGLAAAEAVTTARASGGTGGAMRWEQAQAAVTASFYQHTNRSIEPHLHVHNVMLNKVLCADGAWRAVDGQDQLAQRYGFSAVADRALVESLTARLGLDWIDRPDGAGKESRLVSESVMDHFSTRDRQITAAMAPRVAIEEERLGRPLTNPELARVHRIVQRSTRADKAHGDQTSDELNDNWVAELAAEIGHDLDGTADDLLQAVAGRLPAELARTLPPDLLAEAGRDAASAPRTTPGARARSGVVAGMDRMWSEQEVIAKAVAGCADRSATWGRANLKLELERNLPVLGIEPGQVQEFLEALTDRALASAGVVQVAGKDAGVYAPGSAARYAAVDTLDAEASLRAAAVERGRHALDRAAVAAWLDAHAPTIGADQRAAVEGLASSDAALAVLVGPAGTGKSFAAGALSAAWSDLTAGEGRVIGLAVTQKATEVLRDDGIGMSRNIAQWLATQDRLDRHPDSRPDTRPDGTPGGTPESGQPGDRPSEGQWALRRTDVVMVDEASMVGTKDLEAIRARVEAAGARLVLTGDPRQLGPVEAGGAMGLLDGHAETYTLTEVRRFANDWERAASLAVRDGAQNALDEYDRHARLVEHATVDAATTAAAAAAVADRLDGRSVVVVAASNAQAAAVAAKIRDQLTALDLVQTEGGVPLGRDGNTASTGDVIACRRNDYALGVTNRLQYTVQATSGQDDGRGGIVPDGALLVQPLPTPGRPVSGPILLPADYVAADVQLGYASTVHAAQGLTVERAHLVAGGGTALDAATLYVAMTRGQERNTAHVALATPGKPSNPAARTPRGGQVRLEDTTIATSARDVLQAGLNRHDDADGLRHVPGPGTAATVAAEREDAHLRSMATITAQLDTETRAACRARLETHLDDLVADGVLDEDLRAQLAADQTTEHLSRLLRAVEQDGRDPRQTLTEALTRGRSLVDAASPAQVLAHRISRGRPDHALTAPAPEAGTAIPADIPEPVATRLKELHSRAEARTTELGTLTAEQAPDWAVLALGPVPPAEHAEDRPDWEHRAGLVAAHREAVGDTDLTRALGRMPGLTATERRAGYAAAWHALGRPDTGLEEAAMTEGRLRVRVQAWEREQSWQPPYVDDQLRAAETDLETARQAAALAEARAQHLEQLGDVEQAERLRVEAAEHRATVDLTAMTVEGLTRDAELHSAWVAHTAVTRDVAERARAAAEQRGIELDTPADDTTTAEEWLAHQAERITAEDAHRPVTEADLADAHSPADDHTWNTPAPDEHLPEVTNPLDADRPGREVDDHTNDHVADTDDGHTDDGRRETAAEPEAEPAVEPAPSSGSDKSAQEVELLTSGASLALSVMADRASQEEARTAAAQEDLAIESADAGRRRRELADLDAAATGTDVGTEIGTDTAAHSFPDTGAGASTGSETDDAWGD